MADIYNKTYKKENTGGIIPAISDSPQMNSPANGCCRYYFGPKVRRAPTVATVHYNY